MSRLRGFLAGVALVLLASTCAAQSGGPYIPGDIYVAHLATRANPRFPEGALAPGSLAEVNVTGLYDPHGPLTPESAITLEFRSPEEAGASALTVLTTEPNFYGQLGRAVVLIPPEAPEGEGELIARASTGETFSVVVWIANSAFGLFTNSSYGGGSALAQVYRDEVVQPGLTTPLRAGEWVTLWGTGLGAGAHVSIDVGGVSAVSSYAGPAPDLIGVDQINFLYPPAVPADCYVPLAVEVDGVARNSVSIPSADEPGPCPHRLGFSEEQLSALDSGQRVPLAQATVSSTISPDFAMQQGYYRVDAIAFSVQGMNAHLVQLLAGPLRPNTVGCRPLRLGGVYAVIVGGDFVLPYDTGVPIALGPGGERLEIADGVYRTPTFDEIFSLDEIPPFPFTPGEWFIDAPGGEHISTFRIPLHVPPPLQWLNRDTISPVRRDQDLTIVWDAAGYTDREWVDVAIGSYQSGVGCSAPAIAGSLTVPAALLSQLADPPADLPPVLGFVQVPPSILLSLRPAERTSDRFALPLVDGGSAPGIATFQYAERLNIALQ